MHCVIAEIRQAHYMSLYVALQELCHTTSLLDSTFALALAAVVEHNSDCAVQERLIALTCWTAG